MVSVNTTVVYLKVAKGADLQCSHPNRCTVTSTTTKWELGKMREVLTNLEVAIISQDIHVSNHHIIHLQLTQSCMSIAGGKF